MKTLCVLIVLHACLSSGQHWTGHLKPHNKFASYNWNSYVPQKWGPLIKPRSPKYNYDVHSPFFLSNRRPQVYNRYYTQVTGNPDHLLRNENVLNLLAKNQVRNEILGSNGIQNNLPYYSGRYIGENVDLQELDPGFKNYVDVSNWNKPDPSNECYNLIDIINDLSAVLRTSNISKEKQNLKKLFWIIRQFILNNNLQHASFSVIVNAIENILLNVRDDSSLKREADIGQILEQFKNEDLYRFILEIRSNPDIPLQVIISKLSQLLLRLKQILINNNFSPELIESVINQAAQWSVPLVGYYFERECKKKTQRYIVQNLEAALNVKLGGVKDVGSLDGLGNLWGLNNSGSQGYLRNSEYLWELGNRGSLAGLGSTGSRTGPRNPAGLGNRGNLGGTGSIVNIIGPWNTAALGNRGIPGGLGSAGSILKPLNLAVLGNRGNPGGLGGAGSLIRPWNIEPITNQGNRAVLGGAVNQENAGFENLDDNQGNLGGLSGVGSVVGQRSQKDEVYLGNLEVTANKENLLRNLQSINNAENQTGSLSVIDLENQGIADNQGRPQGRDIVIRKKEKLIVPLKRETEESTKTR